MQTLSSASRTCMASASAVECTATVAMPSSLHARNTRRAISPRLAMRILSNMPLLAATNGEWRIANRKADETGGPPIDSIRHSLFAIRPLHHSALFNDHQRFAELD